MKYNAHIKQSNDDVADLGYGKTVLTDGSGSSALEYRYWGENTTYSIKEDRPVGSSTINNDSTAFKESFIQRMFCNKKNGGNYYYDKFFTSNTDSTPVVQVHEVPTFGQMADYLLHYKYGIVYNHVGRHLGTQSSIDSTTVPPNEVYPEGPTYNGRIFNFEWIWNLNGTTSAKPFDWATMNLVNKINWILRELLVYDGSSKTTGFKLYGSAYEGADLVVSNIKTASADFTSLRAGYDDATIAYPLNPLFSVTGGATYSGKAISVTPYYDGANSYNAVIRGETGSPTWVANGNYSGTDLNRYYLRNPDNAQYFTAFGGSSTTIRTFLDVDDNGSFRVNYGTDSTPRRSSIVSPINASTTFSSGGTDYHGVAKFIVSKFLNGMSEQSIDSGETDFTFSFSTLNKGIRLISPYGVDQDIRISTGHDSRGLIYLHDLKNDRKIQYWFNQRYMDSSGVEQYGSWYNASSTNGNDYIQLATTRGVQRFSGQFPSGTMNVTNYTHYIPAIRLDTYDSNGRTGYTDLGTGIPCSIGSTYQRYTSTSHKSYFTVTQGKNFNGTPTLYYCRLPELNSSANSSDPANFIVTKPNSFAQTILGSLTTTGALSGTSITSTNGDIISDRDIKAPDGYIDVGEKVIANGVPVYNNFQLLSSQAGIFLPRGYIDGFKMEKSPQVVNDNLRIHRGKCLDSTGQYVINFETEWLDKSFNGSWVAGSGSNGMSLLSLEPSAPIVPGGFFFVFVVRSIYDGYPVEIGFDNDINAVNLLTRIQAQSGYGNHSIFRRVGMFHGYRDWIYNKISDFSQFGDTVQVRGYGQNLVEYVNTLTTDTWLTFDISGQAFQNTTTRDGSSTWQNIWQSLQQFKFNYSLVMHNIVASDTITAHLDGSGKHSIYILGGSSTNVINFEFDDRPEHYASSPERWGLFYNESSSGKQCAIKLELIGWQDCRGTNLNNP